MAYRDRADLYFKTASDGRRLFFPWLYLGQGYLLASEQDYERLRRRFKAYQSASMNLAWLALPAIFVWLHSQYFLSGIFLVIALWIAFGLIWTRHLAAGLEATNERLSLDETFLAAARQLGSAKLWLAEIGCLAFLLMSAVLFIVGRADWIVLCGAVFFGFGAVSLGYQLILLRRFRLNAPSGQRAAGLGSTSRRPE